MSKKIRIPSKKKHERLHLFSFENELISGSAGDMKSHIELFSNKEITVERCGGILEYGEDFIKLRLIKGGVIIFGKELYIACFENGVIKIRGKISSVEFCV